MDDNYSFDLEKLKEIIFFKFKEYLIFCFVMSSLILVITFITIKKDYEYLVILDVGSNKILGTSDLIAGAGFGKKGGSPALVSEVIEYIEMQYMKNPRYTENVEENNRLFEVENIENTDQIKIKTRADSLAEAKKFSYIMIKEVNNKFKERISGLLNLNLERVTTLDQYAKRLSEQINEIDHSQKIIGFNTTLIEQKAQLLETLMKVESDKSATLGLLKSGNIRPMKIILSRPTSYRHVAPKYTLIFMLSFSVLFIICLGHALLLMIKSEVKKPSVSHQLNNLFRKIG